MNKIDHEFWRWISWLILVAVGWFFWQSTHNTNLQALLWAGIVISGIVLHLESK